MTYQAATNIIKAIKTIVDCGIPKFCFRDCPYIGRGGFDIILHVPRRELD